MSKLKVKRRWLALIFQGEGLMVTDGKPDSQKQWWASLKENYPPRLTRSCNCLDAEGNFCETVLIEHFLPNGQTEYFLHRVCRHNRPSQIEMQFNKIGSDPLLMMERYRGIYRVLSETMKVEKVDWFWLQCLWIQPAEKEELAEKWRAARSDFSNRKNYLNLSGWEEAWQKSAEILAMEPGFSISKRVA